MRHKVGRSRRVKYWSRIVRVVESMAERDEGWSRLAEQLRAVLVDPGFDLDAPVDLTDLLA